MDDERAFVLIAVDEPDQAEALAERLVRAGHACRVVSNSADAVASVHQRPPDVVVAGLDLGGGSGGLDVLRETRRISPDTEVILVTGKEDGGAAQEAVGADEELRAYDYLTGPLDLEEACKKVGRAARQALTSRMNRDLLEQLDKSFSFEGIIGSSEAMAKLVKRIKQVARSKISVLIVGESGTGKDLVARAIHHNSDRSKKPFKVANCAGFHENLLESELFGHVKGSFTGASSDRKGLFEAAHGGTLFLDEIGDMPLAMQAKLLRALEAGEIVPVGSNDARKVDVRVIAATHRDLREMVKEDKFRNDLLYRINSVTLRIPPLRERREDTPLLIDTFIRQANEEHGTEVRHITPEARRKLVHYHWQENNVRELKNTIAGMVVLAEGDTLDVDDLPERIRGTSEIVPVS
ncbi:MAG: sigma-54-dependent Fis family transcriptional regulator, partial [Phycisphaerales bacterium]